MPEKMPSSLSGEKYKKIAANANDWAEKIGGLNQGLADVLSENKLVGFKRLEELNLPRYKMETLKLLEFLEDPQGHLDAMGSKLFYVGLIPREKDLERHGEKGINAEQVLEFIREKIPAGKQEGYDIVIQQYFENKYGGNIQIGKEPWQVLVELKRGNQGEIAKGIVTPEFISKRDESTGTFKYTFEDEELRKAIQSALDSIPHYGDGFEKQYRPGYYELVIAQRDEDSGLEPLFFDCKPYDFDWRINPDMNDAKEIIDIENKKKSNENN